MRTLFAVMVVFGISVAEQIIHDVKFPDGVDQLLYFGVLVCMVQDVADLFESIRPKK